MDKKGTKLTKLNQYEFYKKEEIDLLTSLKYLITLLLIRFKESNAYRINKKNLADIDLLPMAYLQQHYPMAGYIMQRDYLMQEMYADNMCIEDGFALSEYFDAIYYPGNSHIQNYLVVIDELSNNLYGNDVLTIILLNEYLDNYVNAKKMDLDLVQKIIDQFNSDYSDIEWLKTLKENCLMAQTISCFTSPFSLPVYLEYRQDWIFDDIRSYFITKNEDSLQQARIKLWNKSYLCRVHQFYEQRIIAKLEDITLIFTVNEKKDIVEKLQVEVSNEDSKQIATVMEAIPKSRVKYKNTPDRQYGISYPDMMQKEFTKVLRYEHLNYLYYVLASHTGIRTAANKKDIEKNLEQDINTFVRKILPLENAKSVQYLQHNIKGKESRLLPSVKTKVINLSGTEYQKPHYP